MWDCYVGKRQREPSKEVEHAKAMPLISMPLIGRLGNLLFQYAYLRAYAEQNGYEVCLPPWIGERVFAGVPEAVRPDKYKPDKELPQDYCQRQECLIYTRKQVKEWFAFKPEVLERLKPAKCECKILINLRMNIDYLGAGMVCIGLESYDKAKCKWFGDSKLECDVETDVLPRRLFPDFTGDPWASGLGTTEVCLPSFYRLMTAPVLFRANSSFSWWASTLSDGRIFSPVIEGMKGGVPNQHCDNFVEGNWPRMSQLEGFTDLRLRDE